MKEKKYSFDDWYEEVETKKYITLGGKDYLIKTDAETALKIKSLQQKETDDLKLIKGVMEIALGNNAYEEIIKFLDGKTKQVEILEEIALTIFAITFGIEPEDFKIQMASEAGKKFLKDMTLFAKIGK